MTVVNYFPYVGGLMAVVAGVLISRSVSGWLDLLGILLLVVCLVMVLLLVRDFCRLKKLILIRNLVKFCKENRVVEVVCVIGLEYLVLLDERGEVVKGVYRDELRLGFYEFLETVRGLGRELGARVRWFNSALDVDEKLVQKICRYLEETEREGSDNRRVIKM
jgi:hypothetical protein